jgi:hypothetical protein
VGKSGLLRSADTNDLTDKAGAVKGADSGKILAMETATSRLGALIGQSGTSSG